MTASLTWLDLTSADRDKVRQILDLFKEQGTVDELGLGSLRDALSDALFPGTSVLHTRLRYVLLIPWIYTRLEQMGAGGDIARAARAKEVELISYLADQGNDGVIGIQARESLARLPSSVYWAALSRWGIFVPRQSLSWYHAHFDDLRREARRPEASADDPGVLLSGRYTWHPRLPSLFAGLSEAAGFSLSREEAEFVQAQIRANCNGSLLGWLADHDLASQSKELWQIRLGSDAPTQIVTTLELARQFSLVIEGAPLLYNLMLAEKRGKANQSEGDLVTADSYRREFSEWMERARTDLQTFQPEGLWAFVAGQQVRSPELQRRFVERWLQRVSHGDAERALDDRELRSLIETRERQLKGPTRARLANAGRLADWSGRVGVGRMEFRWSQVRRLLMDLHEGLSR
ncbi:DUF6361 family protein [Metapseudomonas sp. CR1201]